MLALASVALVGNDRQRERIFRRSPPPGGRNVVPRSPPTLSLEHPAISHKQPPGESKGKPRLRLGTRGRGLDGGVCSGEREQN